MSRSEGKGNNIGAWPSWAEVDAEVDRDSDISSEFFEENVIGVQTEAAGDYDGSACSESDSKGKPRSSVDEGIQPPVGLSADPLVDADPWSVARKSKHEQDSQSMGSPLVMTRLGKLASSYPTAYGVGKRIDLSPDPWADGMDPWSQSMPSPVVVTMPGKLASSPTPARRHGSRSSTNPADRWPSPSSRHVNSRPGLEPPPGSSADPLVDADPWSIAVGSEHEQDSQSMASPLVVTMLGKLPSSCPRTYEEGKWIDLPPDPWADGMDPWSQSTPSPVVVTMPDKLAASPTPARRHGSSSSTNPADRWPSTSSHDVSSRPGLEPPLGLSADALVDADPWSVAAGSKHEQGSQSMASPRVATTLGKLASSPTPARRHGRRSSTNRGDKWSHDMWEKLYGAK